MVKLGWGRPISFVTASLGVVIVLPDPKIVILGTFELAVPSPDLPIIDLKGSVFSEITADHALALVVLEDSRVAGYPVSGDLGFLVGFGDDPSFAISAGGFHPRYPAPRELAAMRRLSIDLSPPIVLTIRATAYVAFTTNSFQLGGRLEAEGDAGPVSVHGFVQLDAIVRWAPSFAFEADLSAGFDMRFAGESFAGVQLRLHLQGPAPWMAHGTATLEIPILPDVDVEVGPISWGDGRNPPPPAAHPLGLVREALSVPEAWRPELPRDADALVTLRSDPADPPLLVHPLGMFEGRQRAVPLETTIARVGPSPVPGGEKRIHLGQPTLSDGGAPVDFGAVSGVADHFAPGQFLDLSDDDQLRRPAFEDMPAGIRLGPAGGVRTDPGLATQSDLHYDTVYPHQNLSPGRDVFPLLRQSAFAVLAAGAAGRSALQGRCAVRLDARADRVRARGGGPDPQSRRPGGAAGPRGPAADLLARRGGVVGPCRRERSPVGRPGNGDHDMSGSISDLPGYVPTDAFRLHPTAIPPEQVVLARYTFLPYVRTGIAASLAIPFSWDAPARAHARLSVPVMADTATETAEVDVVVRGPGDVTAFDPRQVIRCYPNPGAVDALTEELAHVEFDLPDFPWLFTPTGPTPEGRLVPWLSLVVVPRLPGRPEPLTPGRRGGPATLRTKRAELPRLADAWAWAHAQVMGGKAEGSVDERLSPANPSINLSRLLCPRHLEPHTAYVACIVPTFRAGTEVGLGQTPPPTTTLSPSWSDDADGDTDVVLPVYFSFTFSTGDPDDFKALAERLEPVVAPPGVGRRRVDTSRPGAGVPDIEVTPGQAAPGSEMVVEGPLVSLQPTTDRHDWPSESDQHWPAAQQTHLRSLLNAQEAQKLAPEPDDHPTLGPPLYAGAHVRRTSVTDLSTRVVPRAQRGPPQPGGRRGRWPGGPARPGSDDG